VTEAVKASRSFPKGYRRARGIAIGAIFLFICGIFLYLSILNFIISLVRDNHPIWLFFVVAVLLSVVSSITIWAIRKIYVRGYAFDRPYVYDTVERDRKYFSLNHSVREMLVDTDNNKLYLSTRDSITIVDGNTDKFAGEIKLKKPRYIALNPANQRLFVTQEKGIAVIDTSTNTVIERIFEENRFGNVCLDQKTNTLYAIDETYNCVDVIDCSSYTLNHRIDSTQRPNGLALNPKTNKMYIGYPKNSSLSIIDNNLNRIICQIQFEKGTADTNKLYVDSTNSKLYILREEYYSGEGGYLDLHELYCVDANVSGSISLVSREAISYQIISDTVGNCGRYSRQLSFAVNPELDRIYMAIVEREDGLVVRKVLFEIDSSKKILKNLEINNKCKLIALNPTTNKLYAANPGSTAVESLEIINLVNENKVQSTIPSSDNNQ
jgi:DNA-binding beta-propeller fold protein YncE